MTTLLTLVRHSYNAILSLKDAKWHMDRLDKLPEETQPQISVEELIACEEVLRNDERVRKLAADVGRYFTSDTYINQRF